MAINGREVFKLHWLHQMSVKTNSVIFLPQHVNSLDEERNNLANDIFTNSFKAKFFSSEYDRSLNGKIYFCLIKMLGSIINFIQCSSQ